MKLSLNCRNGLIKLLGQSNYKKEKNKTTMANKIYPCLWFDGNAKEAAEFHCSVFANSKITTDTPMVVNFELRRKKIMGLNDGPQFKIYVKMETEINQRHQNN
jgi:predicted 3-demethylubiquinone-9 3-methyltransferase (glyoxalase superfamily)